MRQNFDKSDERSYRDGDKQSSRYFKFGSDEEDAKTKESERMYNSPEHNVSVDSLGNMVRKYDKSNKRTTLINDDVRVYKGGSWRDRAYWLAGSNRRFLDEDKSTATIGFRCAMDRVGSPSGLNYGKRSKNQSSY